MSFKKRAIKNQLEHQAFPFHNCNRFALMANIITKFVGSDVLVIDAGGGDGELGTHLLNFVNFDLLDGEDIEKFVPPGDVIVFSQVLEHVVDLSAVIRNTNAKYVLVSVPLEREFPPSIDHVRRLDWQSIRELTGWKLVGKWCFVFRPRFWRIRKFFGVSAFAEEEITLWRTI